MLTVAMSTECACPGGVWDSRGHSFLSAIDANDTVHYVRGLSQLCAETTSDLAAVCDHTWQMAFDLKEGRDKLARAVEEIGTCLPALVMASYACVVSAYLGVLDVSVLRRMESLLAMLLVAGAHCLDEGGPWRLTAGQIVRHLESMTSLAVAGHLPSQSRSAVSRLRSRLDTRSLPICTAIGDEREPLVGMCGPELGHRVDMKAYTHGDVDSDSVVLCTHAPIESLGSLQRQLMSWGGPVSVAVLVRTPEQRSLLRTWGRRWRVNGLRSLHMSAVYSNLKAISAYDTAYPANLMRQVAVQSSPGEIVLVAEPTFVPSFGFRSDLAAVSDLGAAVRSLVMTNVVLLIMTFKMHGAAGNGTFRIDDLQKYIEAGTAGPLDWLLCSLCRPYAWQWLLIDGARSPFRFRHAGIGDINHPMWLARRGTLHFEPCFHGVVGAGPERGSAGGWSGMPRGLRASADHFHAQGLSVLVMPRHFLWQAADETPVTEPGVAMRGRSKGLQLDLLYSRYLASLPSRRGRSMSWPAAVASRVLLGSSRSIVAEVVPERVPMDALITLRAHGHPEAQLVVIATKVLGSPELDRLVESVPWPVHAVSVGARAFWATAVAEMPTALTAFNEEQVVVIVDAYDVVLFPCQRSVVQEYHLLGSEIAIAAEKICWPDPTLCTPCEVRYADFEQIAACQSGFPNLNSGGYIGTARALTTAFEWMLSEGLDKADDQLAWWKYYRAFPERVAIDHRQRIWTTLLRSERSRFAVTVGPPCGAVMSNYSGDQMCFAHGNGRSLQDVLEPLFEQSSLLCGRDLLGVTGRRVELYAGRHSQIRALFA